MPIDELHRRTAGRGPGFVPAVIASARREGDEIEIPIERWLELTREHLDHTNTTTSTPAEPTLAELAGNFAEAMQRWSAAGFPTVTRADFDARSAVCEPCEYWDGAARLGLGRCNVPGCGCTKLKRWLASEKCPKDKWPALNPQLS